MRIIKAENLLEGMTLGLDVIVDDTNIVNRNTILTQNHIDNIIRTNGKQADIWVYDLSELRPNFYKDTQLADTYIDYVVAFYTQLLYSSIKHDDNFSTICKNFKEYLSRNRDVLYDLFVLRENHCYTFEHSISVAMYATIVGTTLNLTDTELYELILGGILHDLGKLKISNAILDKPTKLTDKEFLAIKQHPHYGLLLAKHFDDITYNMKCIIEQHHEKLDGSGYPSCLESNNINSLAKIITVCDIFDAVTSKRSYHNPLSTEKGFEILKQECNLNHVDKGIVDILDNQIIHYDINSFVTLNNGDICLVLKEGTNKKQPIVMSCVTKQVYDLNKHLGYYIK